MSPQFLRWSVEKSLENLKIDTLDILYLHNPETQLGYVDRSVVLERIKEAFGLFESLVEEGKIRAYGIASWNAFLYEEQHTEYLSLSEIIALAREVGGETHHFKYIQSPFNLGKPHAYNYRNQKGPDGKYYTLMQAVHGYGLNLFASSSLLQMNLFKGKFNQNIREILNTEKVTDIATALQFSRSGNVLSALFGSINPQHIKENAMLGYINAAKSEQIESLLGVKNAV
jgi:aryl-alcohol dehydrogenase-like predicted oxidoreductase